MPTGNRNRAGGTPLSRTAGLAAFGAATLAPELAAAYVGPGAGLTALGSALAFLGVAVLLVVGFLWYPAKRLLRRFRGTAAIERTAPGAHES